MAAPLRDLIFLKKIGLSLAYFFHLFSVFSNQHYKLYNKLMWKMSIQYQSSTGIQTHDLLIMSPLTTWAGLLPWRLVLTDCINRSKIENSLTDCCVKFWPSLPHFMQQITQVWMSPKCLNCLLGLLEKMSSEERSNDRHTARHLRQSTEKATRSEIILFF